MTDSPDNPTVGELRLSGAVLAIHAELGPEHKFLEQFNDVSKDFSARHKALVADHFEKWLLTNPTGLLGIVTDDHCGAALSSSLRLIAEEIASFLEQARTEDWRITVAWLQTLSAATSDISRMFQGGLIETDKALEAKPDSAEHQQLLVTLKAVREVAGALKVILLPKAESLGEAVKLAAEAARVAVQPDSDSGHLAVCKRMGQRLIELAEVTRKYG